MRTELNSEQMHKSGHKMIMFVIPTMLAALTAIAGYIAVMTIESSKGIDVLAIEQVNIVKAQEEIKQEIKETKMSQYTKEQAAADRRVIDLELKVMSTRIDRIEKDEFNFK